MEWLDEQWNEPTRTDHYLMNIAAEVRRVNLAKPEDQKSIELDMYKIPFEIKTGKEKKEEKWHPFAPITEEQIGTIHREVMRRKLSKAKAN